jgi:hypothetical protein
LAGNSPRGEFKHAVVGSAIRRNVDVLHDPHISGDGIRGVGIWAGFLVATNPATPQNMRRSVAAVPSASSASPWMGTNQCQQPRAELHFDGVVEFVFDFSSNNTYCIVCCTVLAVLAVLALLTLLTILIIFYTHTHYILIIHYTQHTLYSYTVGTSLSYSTLIQHSRTALSYFTVGTSSKYTLCTPLLYPSGTHHALYPPYTILLYVGTSSAATIRTNNRLH